MKVYVTGIGIVSPIGDNSEENFKSLSTSATGISRSPEFDLMIGQVGMTNEYLMSMLNLPHEDFSRTTLLGLPAAKEAWGTNENHNNIRTGLISATCAGGLDRMEKHYFDMQTNSSSVAGRLLIHDNGGTTEKIAMQLGISGYIGTISTACSSGANAIMQGARLIEGRKLDRVMVGGSDPLSVFNMKGFSSLNIYDENICKPFDDDRKGLNLGEGAAFLVLENEYSISVTGNVPLCILSGWNNSSDAFHQTASSANGEGAYRAMKSALAKANLSPQHINYINAHGTGTGNNDLAESMAIKNIFGDRIPPFSSTKGFTGHLLGAAGAIEAVYCVQAIRSQVIFPNINFSTPMHETGIVPQTSFSSEQNIQHAVSNSFGFGGNCTSLIFSKI